MKEVCDILSYNYKHIEFIDKKVDLGFDCPLDLHCDYTTDVIMAAFGYFNEEKKPALDVYKRQIQLCQKTNQQFNWHGDFVFEEENKNKQKTIQDLEKYFLSEKVRKYVLASGTGNFYSRPEIDLDIARPLIKTMHKMHRAGVDNYVTTDGRIRKLTPRECLRLMGFCDSFKIVVSDTQIYQQAGNLSLIHIQMCIRDSAYPLDLNGSKGR